MRIRLTWLRSVRTIPIIIIVAVLVIAMVAVSSVLILNQRAAVESSVWQTLAARPVHLAHLAAGEPCTVTPTPSRGSPDYAVAVGSGPVYVVGGAASGALTYTPAGLFDSQPGSLGGAEARWQIAPSYTGPVVISGRQLNGPNQISFNGGMDQPTGNSLQLEPPLSELRLMGGGAAAPTWPTWVTLVRLSHPGCYAYQVDGLTFSYTITFQAVSELG